MRNILALPLLAVLFLAKTAALGADAAPDTNSDQAARSADLLGVGNIKVAKDFKIELLYSVPRETEGSWVAMCIDAKGRLIVSDQNGALYRVTLPEAGGGSARTEKINLKTGFAHGLLWAFDSLYVAVDEGEQAHGIYRIRASHGDDQLDTIELLRKVQAGGEHGLHSLVPAHQPNKIKYI